MVLAADAQLTCVLPLLKSLLGFFLNRARTDSEAAVCESSAGRVPASLPPAPHSDQEGLGGRCSPYPSGWGPQGVSHWQGGGHLHLCLEFTQVGA